MNLLPLLKHTFSLIVKPHLSDQPLISNILDQLLDYDLALLLLTVVNYTRKLLITVNKYEISSFYSTLTSVLLKGVYLFKISMKDLVGR